MILRRLIAHFRKQEWTAIFLDFLIVVLGVFMGIQVSNWNSANAIARKAEVFSARLLGDMREEAWGYEFLIEYNKDIRANADRAISALSGGGEMTDEALIISAYRATQFSFNDRKRATFDELIATGDIGLIADANLRETAVLVFNSPIFQLIYDDGRESEFRHIFRLTVPAEVQRALLDHCGDRIVAPGDYTTIVGSLDYECTLDLPASKLAVAASALRENDAILPSLQLRFADVGTALQLLTDTKRVTREKLRAIAGKQP